MATANEVKAALDIVKAIAEAIRDLKQIPSGHLYATLMESMSLEAYQSCIRTLVRYKLVKVSGHLLTWIGDE